MKEKRQEMVEESQNRIKNAGIWLAIGASLFFVSTVLHGIIHPGVGASAAESMSIIAVQASMWQWSHLFFAVCGAIFSAAALVMLNTRTRLTDTALGIVSWAMLAVTGGMSVILTTMEATAQVNVAVAGNLSAFAMWFSLSQGFEIVMILAPISLLGIALSEYGAASPIMPRWASAFAALGAALVVIAIVGASLYRIEAFGPLFAGAALPMLWLIGLGIKLTESIFHNPLQKNKRL